MIAKITVLGKYIGNDINGTWIGGKDFKPGKILEALVDEPTYHRLLLAVENKWFEIKSDNYYEWLVSRGRHIDSFAKPKVVPKVEEIKVVEVPKVEEIKVVEVPKVEEIKVVETIDEAIETIEEAEKAMEEIAQEVIDANPGTQGLEAKLEQSMSEAIETVVTKRRR